MLCRNILGEASKVVPRVVVSVWFRLTATTCSLSNIGVTRIDRDVTVRMGNQSFKIKSNTLKTKLSKPATSGQMRYPTARKSKLLFIADCPTYWIVLVTIIPLVRVTFSLQCFQVVRFVISQTWIQTKFTTSVAGAYVSLANSKKALAFCES